MDAFQNSLVMYLCAYIGFLFDDLKPMYTGQKDWARDKARLLHEIQQHGGQVMTITLPAIGKLFDIALAKGQLKYDKGCYLSKPRGTDKVPQFLGDLLKQVFSPSDGLLRHDPSIQAIVALRQLYYGGKKLELPCSDRRIRDEVKDFYATELSNRRPTFDWDVSVPIDWRRAPGYARGQKVHLYDVLAASRTWELLDENDRWGCKEPEWQYDSCYNRYSHPAWPNMQSVDPQAVHTLQHVCDVVFSGLGDFAEEGDFKPKHGRGAVADLRTGTSKYTFDNWPDTLSNFYPPDYYATHNLGSDSELGDVGKWRNHEVPSKLIAVPKTQKAPRLIAAEPSYNQWIQQLLMQQLMAASERTVLKNCISFRDQSKNQAAAMQGSIDGSLTTVDLSSASDRLTCWTVERALRANYSLLDRLHACRTKWVRNAVEDSVFSQLKLRKFSTMGSAVIFPLQSIIYACVAMAAVLETNKSLKRSYQGGVKGASHLVRVFGDDIIVPTYAYSVLEGLLVLLGLKVNYSKTFAVGNFRESCGVDAFRGVDVTPTYLRKATLSASFEDIPSLIEVGNNFHKAGWWNVAAMLQASISRWEHLLPIVGNTSTQLGHYSFCGSSVNHLNKRWNWDLHREEVRALSFYTKKRRARGSARQDLLQWFTESPEPDSPWVAGTDLSRVVKTRLGWQSTDFFR